MASLPNPPHRSAWLSTSRSDPAWLALYRRVVAMLGAYGLAAFTLVDGPIDVWLEAIFFLCVFPIALWPLWLQD